MLFKLISILTLTILNGYSSSKNNFILDNCHSLCSSEVLKIDSIGVNIVKSKSQEINKLSRTFGYLKSQEYSLDLIRQTFPELEKEVLKSELEFEISFKNASTRIDKRLRVVLGSEFQTFESQLSDQLKLLISSNITKEIALQFIQEVRNRAKGNIESPVLETLLTYQFIEAPENEFLRRFIQTYSTQNHPKSKGVTINYKLPNSWEEQEGDRPNIIKKYISENGDGKEIVMLMVKDLELSSEDELSQSELYDFFSESSLKELVPENNEFISAKNIILDNYTGGQIIYRSIHKRLDLTFDFQSIQYITIYNGKVIYLNCMVYAKSPEELSERFELFYPLFRQMANSLILIDQY